MDLSSDSRDIGYILSSNTVPSALEAASVQHGIDQLTASISQARAELENMEYQLRRHNAALSAIRRFPLELIGQIIRLVAWGVLHSRGRRDLVGLSLVCRSWRQAALLCHEQWKGVHIEEQEVEEPCAFERIVSWYGRAGELPKILEFDLGGGFDGYCGCEGEDESNSGCRFLNPTLIRLLSEGPIQNHLSIQITKPSCLRKLIQAIGALRFVSGAPPPWDNLRSLEIDFSGADFTPWDDTEQAGDSFFNYLPQVTSLSLHMPDSYSVFEEDSEVARNVPIHVPPALLRNLTSFRIKCDWEGSHVLKMLENCPNVEKLDVDSLGTNPDESDPLIRQVSAPRLLFPRLHTLKLENQKTLKLLDFLMTPALRDLSLKAAYDLPRQVDHGFCDTFNSFMKASNCKDTLFRLEISNACVKPKTLAESIIGLQGLRRLVLGQIPGVLNQLLLHLVSAVREVAGKSGLEHLEKLVLTRAPTILDLEVISTFLRCLPASKFRLTITFDHERSKPPPTEAQIVEQLHNPAVSVKIIPDEYLEWVYS